MQGVRDRPEWAARTQPGTHDAACQAMRHSPMAIHLEIDPPPELLLSLGGAAPAAPVSAA